MLKSLFFRLISRRPSAPAPRPPEIAPAATSHLDIPPETRAELREWLRLPATKLALSLVERTHPARNLRPMLPRNEADKDAAVCLLNRAYGWERYRDTILSLPDSYRADLADVPDVYSEPL